MKTLVFIPTYRPGGIDIANSSLERQTDLDFDVFISDSLFREGYWGDVNIPGSVYITNGPEMKEGYKRNLAAAYNEAARWAVRYDYDLFISLQDYIWAPPNGIAKFKDVAKKCPDDLITGLTSISDDPWPSEIGDIEGLYSIFKSPYYKKPDMIGWQDCRIDGLYDYTKGETHLLQIRPEHWEANWAAVPVNFFRYGCYWDEEFDRGIAYENMDFAKNAIRETDQRVIMDVTNHSISLPHKDYFMGEREDILRFSNRRRYEERWGPT